MVSLIYLGKENPISYKTVFGMDGFDRHDTDGGNQTADSASDIKVYPESASGCLINDLGKLLNMNPDFYRRRIRRIRTAAIAVGLSAICLIAIFLIPDDSNPVFQNFFSALFGFFLGLASSVYEKFRKWADRVNQTMKDAEGRMPIWEAIYKNSIFYDECFITLPAARVSPTWAQRAWIKIRFPSLGAAGVFLETERKVSRMFSLEERSRAVELYLTTPMTTAQVVECLGYPTRQCLERWLAMDPRYAGRMAKPIIPLETRRKAIEPVLGGMQQKQAAKQLGVSVGAVHNWVRAYRRGGMAALQPRNQNAAQGGKSASVRPRGGADAGGGDDVEALRRRVEELESGERVDAGGGGGSQKKTQAPTCGACRTGRRRC